jgi:hypothetical protein
MSSRVTIATREIPTCDAVRVYVHTARPLFHFLSDPRVVSQSKSSSKGHSSTIHGRLSKCAAFHERNSSEICCTSARPCHDKCKVVLRRRWCRGWALHVPKNCLADSISVSSCTCADQNPGQQKYSGRRFRTRLLVHAELTRRASDTCALRLLTTAADFFRRAECADIERGKASAEAQASKQLSELCPTSAVCITKRL